MRLTFFGLSITSSWGNGHATTYRGLVRGLHRLGHRLDFWERDVEWYAHHRDLPRPPHVNLHLYSDWNEVRSQALAIARESDAVIVGSYFPDATRVLDDLLGHAGPLICFYDIDTPITLEQLRHGACPYLRADQIPACDLYLSFTGGPVLEELQRGWGARLVRALYCACDESSYRSVRRPQAPKYALTFLGTFAPDRQAKVERLLLRPAQRLPEARFRIAGAMYPDVHLWPVNCRYDPHLPPGHHPAFYADSRFTLNLTRQAMVESGYSPSVRLFEAAAAATPIVTDPWPGLREFFAAGSEILVASDGQEIERILTGISLAEAARLGRAAQERVLAAHTCDQRAFELQTYLQQAGCPAAPASMLS
jgi:spore maturation protein CgeB